MIIMCIYRSPTGDFNHFLRLSDKALLSLDKPSMEILICGDFNVDYLLNCTQKQKLSLLLDAYNMIHTVDFPTRIQNSHFSAIDNVSVNKSRMKAYKILPLFNALSDHEAQYIILNKFLPETELKNGEHKNAHKIRLTVNDTVNYCQEQLSQESWEDVFAAEDVNSSFNKFLATFLTIFEANFPYKHLSNDRDRGWISQGIRKSCQRKRSLYIISKNNDNLNIKVYYKNYCSILRRVIRETKKIYFKQLLETSENKTKTMWTIINRVTRKAKKSNHLPHTLQMDNTEVAIERSAEVFNNYF